MSLLTLQNTDGLMKLRDLARLVVKHIFDREHCSLSDLHKINSQFENWVEHLDNVAKSRRDMWGPTLNDSMPIGKKGTWEDEMRFQLGIMAEWLVKDERGEWDSTKETWKTHKIDYRHTAQFGFLFPEVYKQSDFDKGMSALKQHMKTNPEDYK